MAVARYSMSWGSARTHERTQAHARMHASTHVRMDARVFAEGACEIVGRGCATPLCLSLSLSRPSLSPPPSLPRALSLCLSHSPRARVLRGRSAHPLAYERACTCARPPGAQRACSSHGDHAICFRCVMGLHAHDHPRTQTASAGQAPRARCSLGRGRGATAGPPAPARTGAHP